MLICCVWVLVLLSCLPQDDDDEGEGEEEHTKWYKRTRVWLRIAALSMSAILLMVGVLTHNVEGMKQVNNSGVQLFR